VSASGFWWRMRSAGVAGCAIRYGSRANPLSCTCGGDDGMITYHSLCIGPGPR
jgi:hypothetical protein